jgi:large repetitive protein
VTQMEHLHSIAPDRAAQSGPACDSWADHTGQATCTATMPQASYPLSIYPTSLPGATDGVTYANYVVVSGGKPGYTFALPPHQSLPGGLQIGATGLVSGRPTVSGHYVFGVQVTDSTSPNALSTTQTVSITIAPPHVAISTASLPAGITGVPYAATLAATGGRPPYTWSGTGLPSGLSLSSTGKITGTPATSSKSTVDITVTDSSTPTKETATQSLPLTVRTSSKTSGSAVPATTTWGRVVTYSATVSATGGAPSGTVTFTVGSISLCTAPIASGHASCTATTAPVGTDTVTATYGGSSVYATSSGTTPLTVLPPPAGYPVLISLSRTSGTTSGGTSVTITGSGFNTVQHVQFGTTTARSYVVKSATQIQAVSPSHPAGTVAVTVTTPLGTTVTTPANNFKYVSPPPVVITITPSEGVAAGGTTVTVTGSGLFGTTAVKFGSVTGTSISANATGTRLTVKSPPGTLGTTVDVRVVTPSGESAVVAADKFTYGSGAAITSMSRTSGPVAGGTSVTITGHGFSGVTHVKFGTSTAKSYSVKSSGQIVAVSPAHGAVQVRVSVTTSNGMTPAAPADLFTFK